MQVYYDFITTKKESIIMTKTKTCVCLSAKAKRKLEFISIQRNLSQSMLIEKLILRTKRKVENHVL